MRSSIAAFLGVLALASPAPAETVPPIAALPAAVAARRPDVAQQRTVLVAERAKLRERTDQHNARCSAVEEGSAAASCQAELDSLKAALTVHITRSRVFNEAVRGLMPPATLLRLARSPVVLDQLSGLENLYVHSDIPAQQLVSSDLLRWVRFECLEAEGSGGASELRRQLFQLASAELLRRGELPEAEELGTPPKTGGPTRVWPGPHNTQPPLPNPLTTRTTEEQVGPTLERLRRIFQGDSFMNALLADAR